MRFRTLVFVAPALALAAGSVACAAAPPVVTPGAPADVPGAGLPPGVALTRYNGALRVTEHGAVIDALDVHGIIDVIADDVTIRRTTVTTTTHMAIKQRAGHTGLVVEDTTLICRGEVGGTGVVWGDYRATRIEVRGCDRAFTTNAHTTVAGSWWDGERVPDVGAGAPGTSAPPPPATTTVAPPPPTTGPRPPTPPPTASPTVPPPPPTGRITVPAACRNDAATANGTRVRPGFPTDATTGPQVAGLDEDALPASGVAGMWRITRPGTVVDGVFHHGIIEVRADDVTIRNSVICGTGNLIVRNFGRNLVIESSIVRGERGTVVEARTGSPCGAAVAFGDYTLRRSEVAGCNDGLKAVGVTEVYDSWFHDNYTRRGGPDGTHNDTLQSVDGPLTRLVFSGNAAYQDPCTSNRHFQLAPIDRQPPIGYLRIERNFFYGINGINLDREQAVSDGLVSANTFAGSAARGPFNGLLYAGNGMGTVRVSGNRYESGEPADTNPGGSYQCVGG
jgi:hypothetical protein